MFEKHLLQPHRLRRLEGSFAFFPHRFLRGGFLAALTPEETRLYVFYALAADRQGLSYYHPRSICEILHLSLSDYETAQEGLREQDLIEVEGNLVQLLELPPLPKARF